MNTERPYRDDYPPRNNTKILAVVGVCLGVGLLVFGTPAGLPALAGPAIGGPWPVAAIVCLILGVIGLTGGFDIRPQRHEEPNASGAHVNTNQEPSEGTRSKAASTASSERTKANYRRGIQPKTNGDAGEMVGGLTSL
jgi:hypothetical protein